MTPKPSLFWKILILLQTISLSFERNMEFVPEREDIFSECQDKPGFDFVDKMADLSLLSRKRDNYGDLYISGNLTMTWDVESSDRVAVEVGLLKFEGGIWKPTVFKGNDKDFCKSFYDKNTIYYPFSTEHVTNKDEVKDKCITSPGVVLVVEPFLEKIEISMAVPLTAGRHKAVVTFSAFDKAGVKRPRDICLEIIGDIVKS
ncbi:uncharacterized protein LOC108135862 isoform X1 [Drosophila elegans]|uniref:uncharacterized protein LOC108135862 isoform X1 n=1 Tax=Drosophila elegans TaxID=30023 RepID=UPI0007E886B2|nr:uncharacterized protein LOC108135862 isoform X1 [Drosophila elegans]XP_041565365.1 uncharacterized protein LOC108135862 isoform X1 [Drosophila elegans]XP_041565366.1 uncharacterized protein LOC108135862 isoform X1 [Drosophila elegans]